MRNDNPSILACFTTVQKRPTLLKTCENVPQITTKSVQTCVVYAISISSNGWENGNLRPRNYLTRDLQSRLCWRPPNCSIFGNRAIVTKSIEIFRAFRVLYKLLHPHTYLHNSTNSQRSSERHFETILWKIQSTFQDQVIMMRISWAFWNMYVE